MPHPHHTARHRAAPLARDVERCPTLATDPALFVVVPPEDRYAAENSSVRLNSRGVRLQVVSLCIGEEADAWDTKPFQLEVGGSMWTPPPCSRPPARRRARSPSSSRSISSSRSRSSSSSRSRSRSPPPRDRKFHEPEKLPPKDHRGQRELTEAERDDLALTDPNLLPHSICT